MNKEDIIRMAREAGFHCYNGCADGIDADLERFADLVAAAERESCAKVADEMTRHSFLGAVGAAIRARGNT